MPEDRQEIVRYMKKPGSEDPGFPDDLLSFVG
jgi:hypothetical protein